MLVLSPKVGSLYNLSSTAVRAASTGTCVKRFFTSKLTRVSCGVVCSPRILSTKAVEVLTRVGSVFSQWCRDAGWFFGKLASKKES